MSKVRSNTEIGQELHAALEKIVSGRTHLSLQQLKKDMAEILPRARIKRDGQGQLVIYTGMQADEDGKLYAWVSK